MTEAVKHSSTVGGTIGLYGEIRESQSGESTVICSKMDSSTVKI
jgi:hypothetical protein